MQGEVLPGRHGCCLGEGQVLTGSDEAEMRHSVQEESASLRVPPRRSGGSGINSPAAALVVAGHVTDGCCVPSCSNLLIQISIAARAVVDGPAKGHNEAGDRAESREVSNQGVYASVLGLAGRIAAWKNSTISQRQDKTDTRPMHGRPGKTLVCVPADQGQLLKGCAALLAGAGR